MPIFSRAIRVRSSGLLAAAIPRDFIRILPALFALFACVNTHAQFVIDNFNTNQTLISVSAIGSSSSVQRGTMQGNERDLKVTVTSAGTITAMVRTGVFTYTQDALAVGSADIVWDGIDGDGSTVVPNGLGTLDFTASSQNAFMLGVNSCNQSVNVTLTLNTTAGTASLSVTIAVPASTVPNLIVTPTTHSLGPETSRRSAPSR